MVTHQIPQYCLATVQCRKQRLALGVGSCGAQADVPISIITAAVMHLLLGLFKEKHFLILFFGLGSWCQAFWQWDRLSVNMQPLCCSQCVVQWCSQTAKHVLLNLYDCTYCLLFCNHCKTSSGMSHENIVIDVNIYLIAIFAFFIDMWIFIWSLFCKLNLMSLLFCLYFLLFFLISRCVK